jgi:hypothetical protein
VLYTNRSASVAGFIAFVGVVNRWVQASVVVFVAFVGAVSRWAQALLANSALIKAASLTESVLKMITKQLKSCFLKSLLTVTFKTKALKALLHLSLLSFSQKTMYCLY